MSRPGRPLRVLALAGLALPIWLVARVPDLQRRHAEIMAAMSVPGIVALESLRRPVPVAPDPVVSVDPVVMAGAPVRLPVLARHLYEAVSPDFPVPQALASATPSPSPINRGPRACPNLAASAAKGPLPPPGFDLATRAYQRLGQGERREADRLFAAALAEGAAVPRAAQWASTPQAAQWAAERRQLNRRWSGDVFVLFRSSGPIASAASPVLGGGQSGGMLAYALDPLARRPVAVFGRVYAAHGGVSGPIDGATAQAALGVRWQLLPGVSVAAERLIAVGQATSGDWNVRLAASGERRIGQATLDGYAEAGARGNGDVYAGGQAHAMLAVARLGRVRVSAGPGVWSSVQTGVTTVWRVDAGPGVAAALPGSMTARAQWRWRLAGNAAPGSGPAVTIGWGF